MEKEMLGFKVSIKNEKLLLEIPVDNLVNGFNENPNKFEECNINENYKQEFAEYVASSLIEPCDSETGDSIIMEALDRIFEEAMESGYNFINYKN